MLQFYIPEVKGVEQVCYLCRFFSYRIEKDNLTLNFVGQGFGG